MTYSQIDLFNMVNKIRLEKLFTNWNTEMEGLDVLKEFCGSEVMHDMNKFFQRGYILGDFEILNEFNTLLQRFDIKVNLNKISKHQWEIRMPNYSQQEGNQMFVVKSLEEGYEHEFEFGNIEYALETYTILLNSGLTNNQLKFEVLERNMNKSIDSIK